MGEKIRVTIWNEFVDEFRHPEVFDMYPGGIHEYIASYLREQGDLEVRTATFQEEAFGIPDEVLDNTDVLIVYSHMKQGIVSEDRIQKLTDRVVNEGMGLIVLHSGLWLNAVKRILGPCNYNGYREIGERERVWVVNPTHPIAEGLPDHFEFAHAEVYPEPAAFPEPEDLIFLSWYQGGEAARSGLTWRRGLGKIFYFSPGHATFDTLLSPYYKQVVINAIHWAVPKFKPLASSRGPKCSPIEPMEQVGGIVENEEEEA